MIQCSRLLKKLHRSSPPFKEFPSHADEMTSHHKVISFIRCLTSSSKFRIYAVAMANLTSDTVICVKRQHKRGDELYRIRLLRFGFVVEVSFPGVGIPYGQS